MLSVYLMNGKKKKKKFCLYDSVPLKDSGWYGSSPEPVQARMSVSLTAAKTLAPLGTQDQEKVMMMGPKE